MRASRGSVSIGEGVLPRHRLAAFVFREWQAAVSRIVENGKFGFIDRNGKVRIAPRFDFVEAFSGGRAAFCTGCEIMKDGEHSMAKGGKWGYINRKGKIVMPRLLSNDPQARAPLPVSCVRYPAEGFLRGGASVTSTIGLKPLFRSGRERFTRPLVYDPDLLCPHNRQVNMSTLRLVARHRDTRKSTLR